MINKIIHVHNTILVSKKKDKKDARIRNTLFLGDPFKLIRTQGEIYCSYKQEGKRLIKFQKNLDLIVMLGLMIFFPGRIFLEKMSLSSFFSFCILFLLSYVFVSCQKAVLMRQQNHNNKKRSLWLWLVWLSWQECHLCTESLQV